MIWKIQDYTSPCVPVSNSLFPCLGSVCRPAANPIFRGNQVQGVKWMNWLLGAMQIGPEILRKIVVEFSLHLRRFRFFFSRSFPTILILGIKFHVFLSSPLDSRLGLVRFGRSSTLITAGIEARTLPHISRFGFSCFLRTSLSANICWNWKGYILYLSPMYCT